MSQPEQSAVVTIWFLSTTAPRRALGTMQTPDRGFGRKFLALYDPQRPVVPIGNFPLNRSTPPGPEEWYIGSFPGVAVCQTFLPHVPELDVTTARLRQLVPAEQIIVTAVNPDLQFGAFACYQGSKLVREFVATSNHVVRDVGLPEPVEQTFWAGEHPYEPLHPSSICLPFNPVELAQAAQDAYLGFPVAKDGIDIPVAGFATDGRKAPDEHSFVRGQTMQDVLRGASHKLGLGWDTSYDDYEAADTDPEPLTELPRRIKDLASTAVTRLTRVLVELRRRGHKLIASWLAKR